MAAETVTAAVSTRIGEAAETRAAVMVMAAEAGSSRWAGGRRRLNPNRSNGDRSGKLRLSSSEDRSGRLHLSSRSIRFGAMETAGATAAGSKKSDRLSVFMLPLARFTTHRCVSLVGAADAFRRARSASRRSMHATPNVRR